MASAFKIWWSRRELASAVRIFNERVDYFDCDYQLAVYMCPSLPEMKSQCETMHAQLRTMDPKCPEELWKGRNESNKSVNAPTI